MSRKSLSTVMALLLLLSLQVFVCSAESVSTLASTKDEVYSLMGSGRFSEASILVDKLIAENPRDPDLPDTLFYLIAEKCRWSDKYEEEKKLYQHIIQNYPNSAYASKARLGFSRAEVLCLIVSHDYSQAEEAINKLVADFSGHPGLPDTLYWIAERYRWADKYEKAKNIYQQIIQNYPNSSYASRAKLGFSRANVLSLIGSNNYDLAEEAFDKLTTDFVGHPDLPETLYWIAKRYQWSDKYEKAKEIHQQIILNYPDSPFAEKAQPYSQIMVEGIDIFSLIKSGQVQAAKEAIDQLMTDFSGHELLPHTVFMCGERYYTKACQERDKGLQAESIEDFKRALGTWNKLVQLPESGATVEGYYHLAGCYRQLGEYKQAIEHYTKVVDEYPNYRLVWDAQFMIGHTYEKMLKAGLLSESTAKPLISSAYRKVLDKYPDCRAAKAAQSWLNRN